MAISVVRENVSRYHYFFIFWTGEEAIVLKCGSRLCGEGGVLLNVPLLQSKSYFEVKIQQSGTPQNMTLDNTNTSSLKSVS